MSIKEWSVEEEAELVRLYESGMTEGELARQLNRTTDSIGGKLKWLTAHGQIQRRLPRRSEPNTLPTLAPVTGGVVIRFIVPGQLPRDFQVSREIAQQVLALVHGL